jgi:cobalt-zinc-cadmium resistance protein CzcA
LQGQDANLLSIGAVDFGIIIDAAVILVENIFRNLADALKAGAGADGRGPARGYVRADPTPFHRPPWTVRLRLIYVSALQVDKAILFSTAITIAAFGPLFTMQGVEGQIFGPMARTYGYALAGAPDRDVHRDAGAVIDSAAGKVKEVETIVVRALHAVQAGAGLHSTGGRWWWGSVSAFWC